MPFIFSVISLILLLIAPDDYSYWYCFGLHWTYIVMATWTICKNKEEGYINFTTLFSIAYWAIFFIYPIYIYPYRPHLGLFTYKFDESLITYCTALALCAYSFFIFGYNNQKIKLDFSNDNEWLAIDEYEWHFLLKSLSVTLIGLFIVFLLTGGLTMFSIQYQKGTKGVSEQFGLASYIYILLQTITITLVIILFSRGQFKINRRTSLPIICIVVITIMILQTGFRTLPAIIAVIVLSLYNDRIKKINLVTTSVLMIVGSIMMAIVNVARHGVVDSTSIMIATDVVSDKETIDFLSDFYINNRSLYSLVGYTINHGYTYGLTLLSGILGVVPFLVGVFCSLTGIHSDFLGSAQFNSFITLGHIRNVGIGTNIVADIYLAFGLIGVVVIFYIFGKAVSLIKYRSSYNIYYMVAYYILVGRAMYTCRSGIFMNLQPILWSIAILYIFHRLYMNRINRY